MGALWLFVHDDIDYTNMLIDDITIKISAGRGGKGAVAFDKNKGSQGPVGGSGGKGGSVWIEGVSDLSALNRLRFKKGFKAPDGGEGRGQFRDGADAEDLTILVPVGTVAHNLTNGVDCEIIHVGERISLAKGGRGGKGNFLFRSSLNTSPKESQPGLEGEDFDVRLELKFIANVGFIGLPNVGKSSLLNELTNAKSKVANYQFTTLEPNLGVYYDLILADLPGLIEGASEGKGLGDKFLRHIERTRVLFHLISAESASPVRDYKIIRRELGDYNKELLNKKEFLFLTKSDMVSATDLKKKLTVLKKISKAALAISIHDWSAVEKVKKILNKLGKEKNAAQS